MAVFKCKMCGAVLQISEGQTIATCEYCDAQQTLPKLDDNEKKLNLFTRANRLRLSCEFDKAYGVYEALVADFPEEAEAYWGLILCEYGIEYVDDPATGKKVPTCHRSSFDSIFENPNFDLVMEYCDADTRNIYRNEAKQIENLRKGILDISSKEDPYDIFICYKETDENGDRTNDSVIAQDVYDALTDKGYKVFFSRITLEDKLGREYEPYIFAALNSAKVMLAFGTSYDNYNAVWVKNEWSRFLKLIAKDKSKYLIPCFKDIDAYDMPPEFKNLQAQDMGKVGAIQDLLRGIKKIIPLDEPKTTINETVVINGSNDTAPLLKRAFMFLEDGNFESANEYCEKVLDIDPENGQAYLGKLMVELRVRKQDDLRNQAEPFSDNANHQKVIRFGDNKLNTALAGYIECINARNEETRLENIYTQAKNTMNSAILEFEYNEAASLFETIPDYKDSSALATECREKAEEKLIEIKKQADIIRIEKAKHKKKAKKVAIIASSLAAILVVITLVIDIIVIKPSHYEKGEEYFTEEDYINAAYEFGKAGSYKDSKVKLFEIHQQTMNALYPTNFTSGNVVEIGGNKHVENNIVGLTDIVAVYSGDYHTILLKSNGTVIAEGFNDDDIGDFSNWTDIVAIACGDSHAVGVKADGTVVATGWNGEGQCDVANWTDIVAVACGIDCTIGLKKDGTVVATGKNDKGQCNVTRWSNITSISCGNGLTVGLKADGTVVATGWNKYGQRNVGKWSNIVAIDCGWCHTIGLKKDGSVVAIGWNEAGQCDVDNWNDIVAITGGDNHTVGLKNDGTVVAVGDNKHGECNVDDWSDIVCISSSLNYTIGIKANNQ